MANLPSSQAQTVRGPLQDVSIHFKNRNYIADSVAMIKDGVSKVAKITKYNAGDWFRDEAKVRAPGTKAARGGFNTSEVNINPIQVAFAKEITQEDVTAESDSMTPPFHMQQDAVEWAVDKIDLAKEKKVSTLIKATTWADGNAAGEDAGGAWVTPSGGTFLSDIRTGKRVIQSKTGMIPNILVIDYGTFEALKEVSEIAEKIKYVMKDVLTAELLAGLIGVDKISIGSAIENTANETDGTDTFTAANIWETTADKGGAFLFYAPPRMGLKVPAALAQFRVKQANGSGRLTRTWYEDAEDQWVYEAREDVDITALHANLGYQWIDTLLT